MDYKDIWTEERDVILFKARQKNGADMSIWSATELSVVQRILKDAQQEKAKKEKLSAAKISVKNMNEGKLRDCVAEFLDRHPEFCDSFME